MERTSAAVTAYLQEKLLSMTDDQLVALDDQAIDALARDVASYSLGTELATSVSSLRWHSSAVYSFAGASVTARLRRRI